MQNPTVVAIEGRCFAGKTTLAYRLAPLLGGVVAPEYAELGALPTFPPSTPAAAAAGVDHLLSLDRSRARQARACAAGVVIMDRSPLTLACHEYAMAAIGVPAVPTYAIQASSAAAHAGTILVPDAYIHLSVPRHISRARQQRRGPVAAHLIGPTVCHAIDQLYDRWLAMLPPRRKLVLDSRQPPGALADAAARFVHDLDGPPAPRWTALTLPHPARPAVA